jgi:hypothetical protein
MFKAFRGIVFTDTLWSHQPIQVYDMWIEENLDLQSLQENCIHRHPLVSSTNTSKWYVDKRDKTI